MVSGSAQLLARLFAGSQDGRRVDRQASLCQEKACLQERPERGRLSTSYKSSSRSREN